METWKNLPSHPRYEVSSEGRVRSAPFTDASGRPRKERMLKPSPTTDGYLRANLWVAGRAVHPLIHRLVHLAFHGPIPAGFEVNHLNGDRADNRPENLNSLSHGDNVRHSRDTLGALYATYGNAKIGVAEIREIDALLRGGVLSDRAIARIYGLCKASVWNIKRGRTWAHITGRGSRHPEHCGS